MKHMTRRPHRRRYLAGLLLTCTVMGTLAQDEQPNRVDVLLVGGGIMSATLGVWLTELEPQWRLAMLERLDDVARESSNGWNNAGTGHAALAELNYTPERDGRIDITRAVEINEAFQITRQFLAWQVRQGVLKNPRSFINATPHMSFVWGDDNIRFLRKRYEALQSSPLFRSLEYSEDPEQIRQWVPLMMEGRDPAQKIAASWASAGTDVNFGEITRQFVAHLQGQPGFALQLSTEVTDLTRNEDGSWRASYKNLQDGTRGETDATFVFVGAGGAALPLLQKSGIPEARDYAGFPVGGSFLVTENPAIAQRHMAKAYGIASTGAPPMSVPHLDTRVLDGKRMILFGPFATFSTKFLKEGSYFDLIGSMTTRNVWPMTRVGLHEFDLVRYLIGQVLQSDEDRFEALKTYFPNARQEDWYLWQAGQRVQIIKRDDDKGGVLKLGTEVVSAADGSIAGLLGASPGASTAAPIMLELMERVFADRLASDAWQAKLREIVPSYGIQLNDDPERAQQLMTYTAEVLGLPPPSGQETAPEPEPAAEPPIEEDTIDPIHREHIDTDPDLET